MTTPRTQNPALVRTEKFILGTIAGGAIAVGIVQSVFFALRVGDILSGPVEVRGIPTAEPLDAGFAGATFDAVTLTLDDPTLGWRLALIGSALLSTLLTVGICATVSWLCVRVFLGRPFIRSVTWGIGIVAILVFLCGMGAPLLNGLVAERVAFATGAGELPVFLVEVDPAPLAWGFALAVVAGAFEIGQRMQSDTRGLV